MLPGTRQESLQRFHVGWISVDIEWWPRVVFVDHESEQLHVWTRERPLVLELGVGPRFARRPRSVAMPDDQYQDVASLNLATAYVDRRVPFRSERLHVHRLKPE